MVITNYGRSGLSLLMAGSGNIPQWSCIGDGSGAELPTLGSLINESGLSPRRIWSTRDISTAAETVWTHDYNSVEMSGLGLTEFGFAAGSTAGGNNLWLREGFDAVTFDGTNELQLEITINIF
jgi:hypothetical protein